MRCAPDEAREVEGQERDVEHDEGAEVEDEGEGHGGLEDALARPDDILCTIGHALATPR